MQSFRFIIFVVAILAVAFPSAAKDWTTSSKPGDGSVFTFRGFHMGDPLDKKFPGVPRTYAHKKTYCESQKFGQVFCHDAIGDRAPGEKYYPEEPRVGDVIVSDIIFRFLDGKLFAFQVTFDQAHFPKLFLMLEGKYGKASSVRTTVVHNRMGAAFDNGLAIWRTPYGDMKIEQRAIDVETGTITLYDKKGVKILYDRINGAERERGKSAF